MVHIWNLVTLTSFNTAKTIELLLFVKSSVANFTITKDCPRTLAKIFRFHRIRLYSWDALLRKQEVSHELELWSKYQIQPVAFLVPLLRFSTKLQQSPKKTKFLSTEMPPKPYFLTSKDVLQKLERNV